MNHSSVSITAGTGLTGGGDITSSRTLNVIGGKGITANANDIQIDSANVLGMFSASGDLSYNSGTGAFSFSETYRKVAESLDCNQDSGRNNFRIRCRFTRRTTRITL